MKVEHTNVIKSMSDEELEHALEVLQAIIARGGGPGGNTKVINGGAVTDQQALTAPEFEPQRKRPNRLLGHVDSAVGPKPRRTKQREG
jgi:hypothetical protein